MSAAAYSAMVALLLCAAAGCTSSSPQSERHWFRYRMTSGLAPLKPGTQLGLLDIYLQSPSRSPITLGSVRGIGRGLGTVIKVIEAKSVPSYQLCK